MLDIHRITRYDGVGNIPRNSRYLLQEVQCNEKEAEYGAFSAIGADASVQRRYVRVSDDCGTGPPQRPYL
jgi:hypothetical protein